MIAIILILGCFFFFIIVVKTILGSVSEQKEEPQTFTTEKPVKKQSKQKEIVVRTLDIPDDNKNGTYVSKIAGINRHCDETDQGIFKGIIFNESNNPYNPDAMAIASIESNKIIGYIPNDELKKYNRWCNSQNCPCVGFIKAFTNDEGEDVLWGRVTAIKPCNENFVKEQTISGIVWIETSQNMKYNGHLE